MKSVLGLGLVLVVAGMVCGPVVAADPPARAAATAPAPAAGKSTSARADAVAKPSKPLDLRVGNVRKYMMPRDFQTALHTPDADANTVVVQGQREVVPMRMVEDVPMGLASLWYSAKDPKNAWRILAPVVNFQDGPTVDKVPPPVFRWGP